VVGVDVAVGYLASWLWRKARRVGGQVDADVDEVLDASVERLHRAVLAKLGDDPAVKQLTGEASASTETEEVSPRTRQRVVLALEEAAEQDAGFGRLFEELLAEVKKADTAGPGTVSGGANSVVAGGDVTISAPHGVAAGTLQGPAVVQNQAPQIQSAQNPNPTQPSPDQH
jgi:hypothetical protein